MFSSKYGVKLCMIFGRISCFGWFMNTTKHNCSASNVSVIQSLSDIVSIKRTCKYVKIL